jgi:hypothetical protein
VLQPVQKRDFTTANIVVTFNIGRRITFAGTFFQLRAQLSDVVAAYVVSQPGFNVSLVSNESVARLTTRQLTS